MNKNGWKTSALPDNLVETLLAFCIHGILYIILQLKDTIFDEFEVTVDNFKNSQLVTTWKLQLLLPVIRKLN